MITQELLCSYRFFRGRTGCVGRDAEAALSLVRAEVHAREMGWEAEWVDDWEGMPEDGLCSCGCGAKIERCEGCILRDEDGNTLASLWAIWDADRDYRRHIEAELALEAMG